VLVTFPPERVMSALAPLAQPAPSIAPSEPGPEPAGSPPTTKSSSLRRLLFRTGT
jgi:hypothetical protein